MSMKTGRDSARRNNQQTPLITQTLVHRQSFSPLMSRLVLQNLEGVGGGFYSLSADTLVGNYYPNGEALQ